MKSYVAFSRHSASPEAVAVSARVAATLGRGQAKSLVAEFILNLGFPDGRFGTPGVLCPGVVAYVLSHRVAEMETADCGGTARLTSLSHRRYCWFYGGTIGE
ncbi:hypothetical protein LAZ67_3000927 [Cordylochernes scorpioides]|uniref:Uncharacterized protein n=1 Tax=Cordylochernes scorpioides TaxID=51811 RepID=A0ABY6KB68_9ARAC|nr:hypothetical protein LAZ67_3000927 [Cordylochernes scorpioides]